MGARAASEVEGAGRTLVIQTAFLGDVVLTTPLLELLAGRDGPVDVLVRPAAAALLEGHPAVRHVIRYDKHGRDRGLSGLLRIGGILRERRYARIVLPHRSARSAVLALLSGARDRVGFADATWAWTYTRRVPRAGAHETERLAQLAGAPPPHSTLGLSQAEREFARAWMEAHDVGEGFVALAPGSVWATKRWPYYEELARTLERPVVVVGGPEDAAEGRRIAAANPARIHSAAGDLPLRVSAALLEHAGVLVTNDSAPLHLAGAVGTPVVAVFGPTVPAFGFGPTGPDDLVVEIPLACRPCSPHGPQRCPLGHHRCMRDISVEQVVAAVRRRLGALDSTRPV